MPLPRCIFVTWERHEMGGRILPYDVEGLYKRTIPICKINILRV